MRKKLALTVVLVEKAVTVVRGYPLIRLALKLLAVQTLFLLASIVWIVMLFLNGEVRSVGPVGQPDQRVSSRTHVRSAPRSLSTALRRRVVV